MSARGTPETRLGAGREFDRIREVLEDVGVGSGSEAVRVGPGDDATVLGDGLVLSTDLAVEGVHFRFDWLSAREVGYRAAAGGLSDLAAMGAEPVGILVSLAVPLDGALAPRIMKGAKHLAAEFGAELLGGDLTRSPGPCVIDVVSVGRVDEPLLRSAAGPGDELWVTGSLGGAAAAVRCLESGREPSELLRARLAAPRPRVREARWLVEAGVRCGIDLSDGIAGDAGHLAAASGVGIVLEAHALPLAPGIRAEDSDDGGPPTDPFELALHGGEDYELCIAAPAGLLGPRTSEFVETFGIPITRVGRVVEGRGLRVLDEPGGTPRPIEGGGWDHFAAEEG